MLIPQQARSETGWRHGSLRIGLSQLRRQLANPSRITDGNRQRLLDLAKRLARVRALGDEYAGIELSESAAIAVGAEALA